MSCRLPFGFEGSFSFVDEFDGGALLLREFVDVDLALSCGCLLKGKSGFGGGASSFSASLNFLSRSLLDVQGFIGSRLHDPGDLFERRNLLHLRVSGCGEGDKGGLLRFNGA